MLLHLPPKIIFLLTTKKTQLFKLFSLSFCSASMSPLSSQRRSIPSVLVDTGKLRITKRPFFCCCIICLIQKHIFHTIVHLKNLFHLFFPADPNHLTLKDALNRRSSTGRALPKIPIEQSRSLLELPQRTCSTHVSPNSYLLLLFFCLI